MILYFIRIFFRFGWQILIQEYYIRRYLNPFLQRFSPENDGTFTPKDAQRMRYYARSAPTISGASYALLKGRKMAHSERLQMTKLSAAAPMFDDYFDEKNLSEARLKVMITQPEIFEPENTKEKVFVHLLRDIKAHVKHFEFFNTVCLQVFEAQMQAKRQETGGLSEEEVRKITFDKGGYSTLLFKTIMEQPDLPSENEAIYHFGGMVQWVDDVFDVYEDTQAGLQTLFTPEVNIRLAWQQFEHEIVIMKNLFFKIPLPQENIKRFWDLQMFFFSRTMVCFEQLSALQGENNDTFYPSKYERKPLICDMEKWENIRKWMHYFDKMRKV